MRIPVLALAAWLLLGSIAVVRGQPVAPRASPPPDAIIITPGERLDVGIDPAGARVEARAAMSGADVAALPAMDNSYERVGVMRGDIKPTVGKLTFELVSDASGARLAALNGLDAPIAYSAELVFERDGRRLYAPTSICPVRAGHLGLESWGDKVVGIAISDVKRVDAEHMACNGGSALTVEAQTTSERFSCVGDEPGPGPLPTFSVTLIVNSRGEASYEGATWMLSRHDIIHSPAIGFDFAMEGNRVVRGARAARVLAVVGLSPPPRAKTAEIVLLYNGEQVVRRPWRMFAQKAAEVPPNPSARPVAFTGVIPLAPTDDREDERFRALLASIDEGGGSVEVRIVGDDGGIIADGTYDLASPPTHDPAVVAATLLNAQTAAKTPTQCRKLDQ